MPTGTFVTLLVAADDGDSDYHLRTLSQKQTLGTLVWMGIVTGLQHPWKVSYFRAWLTALTLATCNRLKNILMYPTRNAASLQEHIDALFTISTEDGTLARLLLAAVFAW